MSDASISSPIDYPTSVILDAEFVPLGPAGASGLSGSCVKINARGVRPADRLEVISQAIRDAYRRLGQDTDTEYGVTVSVEAIRDEVKVVVAKVNR